MSNKNSIFKRKKQQSICSCLTVKYSLNVFILITVNNVIKQYKPNEKANRNSIFRFEKKYSLPIVKNMAKKIIYNRCFEYAGRVTKTKYSCLFVFLVRIYHSNHRDY